MNQQPIAADRAGIANWAVAPDPLPRDPAAGPAILARIGDAEGARATLWLDPDGLDNLRAGLELAALLYPPSLLQTAGDRSQVGDYELRVSQPGVITARFTRDGYRVGIALTAAEAQAFAAAITAAERAVLASRPDHDDPAGNR